MKKMFAIFLGLSLLGVLFFSLFDLKTVIGDAMTPTLANGQRALLWKTSAKNMQRGDVVSHRLKSSNNDSDVFQLDYLGRIVGLPTESVMIENGNLYIDANSEKVRVQEEYLNPGVKTLSAEDGTWTKIGENEYLILTDKREGEISIPSRLIEKKAITGVLWWKF